MELGRKIGGLVLLSLLLVITTRAAAFELDDLESQVHLGYFAARADESSGEVDDKSAPFALLKFNTEVPDLRVGTDLRYGYGGIDNDGPDDLELREVSLTYRVRPDLQAYLGYHRLDMAGAKMSGARVGGRWVYEFGRYYQLPVEFGYVPDLEIENREIEDSGRGFDYELGIGYRISRGFNFSVGYRRHRYRIEGDDEYAGELAGFTFAVSYDF